MRLTTLAFVLSCLLVVGCGGITQELTSPCLTDEPQKSDPAACPACQTDADCFVLSNACYETASCVPRGGNWAVTDLGCSKSAEYAVPDDSACACINNVCQERR